MQPNDLDISNYDNLSLKYQRFTPSGCNDIGITKFEFVTKSSIPLNHRAERVILEFKSVDLRLCFLKMLKCGNVKCGRIKTLNNSTARRQTSRGA